MKNAIIHQWNTISSSVSNKFDKQDLSSINPCWLYERYTWQRDQTYTDAIASRTIYIKYYVEDIDL